MTRISITCLLLACCAGAVNTASAADTEAQNSRWVGVVTQVSDGDTLWIRPVAGGKPVRIRLDGVDAPEICQTHGTIARQALKKRVAKQTVLVQTRSRDSFGRLLARVSVPGATVPVGAAKSSNGSDVGDWLVREGHAWSYRYRRDAGPYSAQQAAAKAARRGLFSAARPEEPRDFRKRHGTCG